MIKITEHLGINVMTVFIFAFGFVFHYPPLFYITYAIMLLHETAHLIAAKCIGLRVEYVILQPFGANLRLKNRMVVSLADEIILYISGPLINAAAAVIAIIIYSRVPSEMMRIVYLSNTVLFAVNLLPAMPLDGGMIVRRILASFLGGALAQAVMKVLSLLVAAAMGAVGVYAAYKSRNFSVLLFSALIFGNSFTRGGEYYTSADIARKVIENEGNNNITV